MLESKINTIKFFFKKKRIVAQYKLFFGDEWFEASVDSIANHVDKILFVLSTIAWGDDLNNPTIKGDNLDPIIEKLKNKYPNKIIVIKGAYNKQLIHSQAGLSYIKKNMPEMTHCLYIDSDEIYTEEQIRELLKLAKTPKYFNKAIRINYNTYFKSIYYKIYPNKYPLTVVLFPLFNWVEYNRERGVNAKIVELPNLFFEHPAYVRFNDERMRLKIEAHRETEPILGDWYRDVWLRWTPETKEFHPTNPEFWQSVVTVDAKDLPKSMVEGYESWINNLENKIL